MQLWCDFIESRHTWINFMEPVYSVKKKKIWGYQEQLIVSTWNFSLWYTDK